MASSVCPYLQTCSTPACMHHPKDDPVYAGRVGYIDWVHMEIQRLFTIFSVATLQAECFCYLQIIKFRSCLLYF